MKERIIVTNCMGNNIGGLVGRSFLLTGEVKPEIIDALKPG